MFGGVVADESSNLSCGGLGPETADDAEKKLMFAVKHIRCFVSSLHLAYHSVATPSIHRGRVAMNEGPLPGKGQRDRLVAEARPVSFTAVQWQFGFPAPRVSPSRGMAAPPEVSFLIAI